MTRILVLQLCRLGDVLQTTPLLRGLKEREDTHVTLMLLDGFGHAPVPRHLYDDLVLFPFEHVAALVRNTASQWQEALEHVRSVVVPLCDGRPFDITLNVTGSQVSNLLASLIPSRRLEGGAIAADRTRVVRGPWMTYFWASQLARHQGCFNLVDLMAWAGGVATGARGLDIEVPAASHARAREWLRTRNVQDDPLIAVQLGASDERKRWPPERFAETVDRLPERLGRIVFVGTAAERPLFERARAVVRRPVLDAMGETSITELAALLSRCRLLVTNDTGTMHVAAAVGTRIVDLSTGSVFVHETGPYGDGHIAVEPVSACFPCLPGAACSHLSCRDDLTPDDIAAIVRFALGDGPMPTPRRARLLQAGRTASGRLQYVPIWSPSATHDEMLRRASAEMWERALGVPGHVAADMIAPRDDLDASAFRAARRALARVAGSARAAAEAAAQIRHASAATQADLSTRIDSHLQAMEIEGQLEPACQPIVAYLKVATESIAERDVDVVAPAYERELTAAAERAMLLIQLLGGGEQEQAA